MQNTIRREIGKKWKAAQKEEIMIGIGDDKKGREIRNTR
jgi:hypothetical protein